jgi:hypothetical protein
MKRAGFVALVLAAGILGCGDQGSRLAVNVLAHLQAPVTYQGVAPFCPDCGEIEITLTLRPDGVYSLRERVGNTRMLAGVDRGRWELDEVDGSLLLLAGKERPHGFQVHDLFSLRAVGWDGRPIEGRDLHRAASVDPFEDSMRIQGTYRLQEGESSFSDCRSGLQWPVAGEGASAELEAAYWQAWAEPGQRLLVNVTGRLDRRPREGGGEEEVLIVEELHAMDRNLGCESEPPLSRRWKGSRLPSENWWRSPPPAPTRDPGLEELPPEDPLRRIQKAPVPSDPTSAEG